MSAPTTLATGLFKGEDLDGTTYDIVQHGLAPHMRRTGAIAETISRTLVSATGTLATGVQAFTGIELAAGDVVTNITFAAAGTAAATPTNQWASLYSSSLAKLGVTADQLTGAWAANTEKTFTFASPITIPSDGLYYIGINVTAGTAPNLNSAATTNSYVNQRTPALGFYDNTNTSLTNPASAPTTAVNSAAFPLFYAWVS